MTDAGAPARRLPGIGEMIVSARPADEYRAIFDLRDRDLRGPFLDHRARRLAALERFAADFAPDGARYVAASLPRLDELRAGLAADGGGSEMRQVPHEFRRGADRMLVFARGWPSGP